MGSQFDMAFEVAERDVYAVRAAYGGVDYVNQGTFDDSGPDDRGIAIFGWYGAFGQPSYALDAVAKLGVPFVARLRDYENGETLLYAPNPEARDKYDSHAADDEWNLLVPLDPESDPDGFAVPKCSATFMELVRGVRKAMRERAKGGA